MKKRSFRKKRMYKKPKLAAKNLSKRITKIEKSVELKHTDFYVTRQMNQVGSIEYIFPCPYNLPGVSDGRIGDEVNPTSVNIHAIVKLDALSASGGNICRMILLWDKTPGGALPTLFAPNQAILDNSVITETTLMPYNYDMKDRFKILWDYKFALNSNFAVTTTPATGVVTDVYQNVLTISKKVKLSRTVKYNQNIGGNTIADVAANSLLLCLISDQTSNDPICELGIRTYFKDA